MSSASNMRFPTVFPLSRHSYRASSSRRVLSGPSLTYIRPPTCRTAPSATATTILLSVIERRPRNRRTRTSRLQMRPARPIMACKVRRLLGRHTPVATTSMDSTLRPARQALAIWTTGETIGRRQELAHTAPAALNRWSSVW